MKLNTISFGLVAVMFALFTGCQTAPMTAKTTIAPMPHVNPLTSVKRTTVVSSSGTNITMVESVESPEQGQLELKKAELTARTKVGVAKAKAKASRAGFWGWLSTPSPYYYGGGYYSSGYSGGGYYGGIREGGVNYVSSTPGGYPTTSPQYQGGNGIHTTPGGPANTNGRDGGGNYVYGGQH